MSAHLLVVKLHLKMNEPAALYTYIASRHLSKDLGNSSTHDPMLRKDSTKVNKLITAATSDLEGAEDPCTAHVPLASHSHSCCPAA